MMDRAIQNEIRLEMERARQARQAGFEGKARVCARRAAGRAAQVFLRHSMPPGEIPSPLQSLSILAKQDQANPQVRLWIDHLTMRVDEAYNLPPEIDLLDDANQLIRELIKE